jgi:sigma-E factor negative regulatory protein RseC
VKEHIVTHSGIVNKVGDNKIQVSIISKAACVSCEINESCSLSDMEEKIIDVDLLDDNRRFEVGQQVVIEMKESLGTWAVLLGYVFPFLLVFISLIIYTAIGMNEGLAGLFSVLVLAPYYIILYLSRRFLRKKFTYQIQ